MSSPKTGSEYYDQLPEEADFNNITDFASWVLCNPAVSDDQTIYIDATDPRKSLTRGQVLDHVQKLAAGLRYENQGAPLNGATVCLHAFNDISYPSMFHGILASGGCYTGTNPAYTSHELEHHLRLAGAKFVITALQQCDVVLAAVDACDIPPSNIFVVHEDTQPKPSNVRSYRELLQHGLLPLSLFNELRSDLPTERPAVLMATSGTSGLPKIAARTHQSLILECKAIFNHDLTSKPYRERRLITIPMFHAFALPLAMMSSLRCGIPTYIAPRFQIDSFLDTIERFAVTEVPLAPPVLLRLLNVAETNKYVKAMLTSLRTVWCGGAPLGRSTQAKAQEELLHEDARICQTWGMTECGWVASLPYPEYDDTGSVGRLLPGCEVKILPCGLFSSASESPSEVDETTLVGHPSSPGHYPYGEILIKSPWRMTSYLSSPTANATAFTEDGWYRTGDVGYVVPASITPPLRSSRSSSSSSLQAPSRRSSSSSSSTRRTITAQPNLNNGMIHLVDRAKDLIKARGWQVSPSELEAVLLRHPLIVDVAVVGFVVDEDTLEEAPRAFVVIKDTNQDLELDSDSEEDIIRPDLPPPPPPPPPPSPSTSPPMQDQPSPPTALLTAPLPQPRLTSPDPTAIRPTESHRASIDAAQIKKYVSRYLARFKWAQMDVVFVDEAKGERIPKSASGKILRRVLAREGLDRVG